MGRLCPAGPCDPSALNDGVHDGTAEVVRSFDGVRLITQPPLGVGPARPAFSFRDADLLVHGLTAGLELRY